jgi:hypothetical protein
MSKIGSKDNTIYRKIYVNVVAVVNAGCWPLRERRARLAKSEPQSPSGEHSRQADRAAHEKSTLPA